jgi:RNA polymerase sigma-70 factor (ECF subfamily)
MLLSNDHADRTFAALAGANPMSMQSHRQDGREGNVTTVDNTEVDWAARVAAIAQTQDQAAFAQVFRHFAPRVKAFLMKSGTDAALAEECMQDVMATLWNKAHLYDPSRAAVSTWIFTIARNRKIDLLRRYARPEPEDLPWGPEDAPDQADVLALQQETTKLAEAIRMLPEKQRLLIERAYFGDLTHSEIAAETGLPLGTIKSRIRLALERLRHAMT